MGTHEYSARLTWTGSTGEGIRACSREHSAELSPGTSLALTADPAFRGDPDLPNPEQLPVVAASSCQLLSFLGAASRAGVDVLDYEDDAAGGMPADSTPMSITQIELRPRIRVRGADEARVQELIEQAHRNCFIANSLRSEIRISPRIEIVY